MKTIISMILTVFSFNAYSLNCYVINESRIEMRTKSPSNDLHEPCPKDDKGDFITTIKDMSYKKINKISCSSKEDCEIKSKDLCMKGGEFQTKIGRLIILKTYDEAYCVNPVFSKTKRKNRINKEKSFLNAIKSRNLAIKKSKDKIELLKVDIDSMTLIGLKELIKEMLVVIGD